MNVQPSPATRVVGDNDEVDRPFGWGEVGGFGWCFRRCIGRGEAHLRGGKSDEDFDIGVGEDVCKPPRSVVPFREYEEAEERGVVG